MTKGQITAMERDRQLVRLIDAASDMLATLEQVDAYLAPDRGDDDEWHEIRAIIQAAITKAKGG